MELGRASERGASKQATTAAAAAAAAAAALHEFVFTIHTHLLID